MMLDFQFGENAVPEGAKRRFVLQFINTEAEQDRAALIKYFEYGYTELRKLPNGDWCGLVPFLYTTAIVTGLNDWGYEDRWCYRSYAAAMAALDAWDGEGEPQGWHRHPTSGRRRDENGNEYVEP